LLCPYCNKRPLKKATCGHADCQIKHNHRLNVRWYQDYRNQNNEGYRKGAARAKFDRQVETV